MKVVNEIKSGSNGESPQAGCVCNSGWKSTRGPWQPTFLCNCNCISGNNANKKANKNKANEAQVNTKLSIANNRKE